MMAVECVCEWLFRRTSTIIRAVLRTVQEGKVASKIYLRYTIIHDTIEYKLFISFLNTTTRTLKEYEADFSAQVHV